MNYRELKECVFGAYVDESGVLCEIPIEEYRLIQSLGEKNGYTTDVDLLLLKKELLDNGYDGSLFDNIIWCLPKAEQKTAIEVMGIDYPLCQHEN